MYVKKGDLFETSWGYDQTNYDFIVVVSISKTGKTAICQLAEYETVGNTMQQNIQKPISKGFGYKFRMKVCENGDGSATLRGSYPFCFGQVKRLSDGEKPNLRLGGFSKVKEGQIFYETDSMFGH